MVKALYKKIILLALLLPSLSEARISNELASMPISLLNGKAVTLNEFKGKKPIYLKFWATWCSPCMKQMPHFQAIQEKYGESIEVISINLGINDSLADVRKITDKYGLNMPVAIDSNGKLAQAFNFIGTPYHLLFDKSLNLIHRGHKADKTLDNKIALLSNKKSVDSISAELLNTPEPELLIPNLSTKDTIVFFTATWCDWYLKDTRPKASANCVQSQLEFNLLAKKYPGKNWVLVVSRLWTLESDLNDYVKKYKVLTPAFVDVSNKTFNKYEVKDFPTVIFFAKGKEVYRTTNLKDSLISEKGVTGA